jgi:outer membrane protein
VTLAQGRHDAYVARASLLSAMGMLEAQFLVPKAALYRSDTAFRRVRDVDAAPWEGAVETIDRLGAPSGATPRVDLPNSGGEPLRPASAGASAPAGQ